MLPPPVAIEAVFADKKKIEDGRGGIEDGKNDTLSLPFSILHPPSSLKIPPGRGELEFRYTALSFNAAEKNCFRYKLEGADSDWVDAGTRRAAYYYNLPPGDYVFRVTACNNDGVWNQLGENVKFSTDVEISLSATNATGAIPWWQGSFPESTKPENFDTETKTIGGTEITYVTLLGVYQSPTNRGRTLQGGKWVGVVLPAKAKNQFIHDRIFGPKDEVDAELGSFKKMVEDALRNR